MLRCIGQPSVSEEKAFDDTGFVWGKLIVDAPCWSHYIDLLRDDLWTNHYNIHIVDFDFYSLEIFNRCENSNDILIAIENWKTVHPLLKILPVDWNYTIPFGILHAPEPSKTVQRFLQAIPAVMEL